METRLESIKERRIKQQQFTQLRLSHLHFSTIYFSLQWNEKHNQKSAGKKCLLLLFRQQYKTQSYPFYQLLSKGSVAQNCQLIHRYLLLTPRQKLCCTQEGGELGKKTLGRVLRLPQTGTYSTINCQHSTWWQELPQLVKWKQHFPYTNTRCSSLALHRVSLGIPKEFSNTRSASDKD